MIVIKAFVSTNGRFGTATGCENDGYIRVSFYADGAVHQRIVNRTIFREEDFMMRGSIAAILEDKQTDPNFAMGAVVQRILDAAPHSHREKRWVAVAEVGG